MALSECQLSEIAGNRSNQAPKSQLSGSNLASNKVAQAVGVANLDALRERMRCIQEQMMATSNQGHTS